MNANIPRQGVNIASDFAQMRNSSELHKHRDNLQKRFGREPKLPREALRAIIEERDVPGHGYENGAIPVGESLRNVLNFYEFVSAGVHLEDLDQRLIQETMRTILINFYNFSEAYIEHVRKMDYGKANDRLYRHYRFLVKTLETAPP